MDRTLVIIKPDVVKSKKIGEIISIYEENNLLIEKMKLTTSKIALLEEHYKEHIGKSFYNSLIEFMSSGQVVAIVLSGRNVVERVRDLNGATNPSDAIMGTIRKRYGTTVQHNAVHGSANEKEALREIKIWFGE